MLRVLPETSVIPTLALVFVWRTMQDLAVMFVMKDTTIFQGVQVTSTHALLYTASSHGRTKFMDPV